MLDGVKVEGYENVLVPFSQFDGFDVAGTE